MTDDDASLAWEDAYRSPADRTPPPPARPRPAAGQGAPPGPPSGATEPGGHPAWGTPDSAPVRQGPVPVAAGRPGPAAAPVGPAGTAGIFVVLVEQNTGTGDAMKWKAEPEPTHAFPTRDAARAIALDLARRFSPNHPFSEQSRSVYRVSPDEYLVAVRGMTSLFHFRVTVAERVV